MFECWLCGEELEIGMTWCPECSAAQVAPEDPADNLLLLVNERVVSMTSAFAVT
jgi:hypothetical protein